MNLKNFIKSLIVSGFVISAVAHADSIVKVENIWVKPTMPGAKVSAVFFKATSPVKGKLVKAESPVAKITQLHDMYVENNVMKMREVPAIPMNANQPLELKPGGLHVMLIDLKQQLKVGESVPVKLSFQAEGSPVEVIDIKAVVKEMTPPAGGQKMQHQGHQH